MPEKDREMFSKLYQQKVHYDGDDGIHAESIDERTFLNCLMK